MSDKVSTKIERRVLPKLCPRLIPADRSDLRKASGNVGYFIRLRPDIIPIAEHNVFVIS